MAERSLVLTFINEEGTRANITLPGVREDITEQEVSAAMDSIVSRNIFFSAGGNLVAKNSAQVTERNVTELSVR